MAEMLEEEIEDDFNNKRDYLRTEAKKQIVRIQEKNSKGFN